MTHIMQRAGAHMLMLALVTCHATPSRADDRAIESIVARHVQPMLSASGGVAVAIRIAGANAFFSYGSADIAKTQAVTPDSLFNLASVGKVLDVALLMQAVGRGEISLDDSVAKHVVELRRGGDIRRITLGQLASHTSGLSFPQDHPPWPKESFTLAKFIRALDGWRADADHQPGNQFIYSHAGYVLLQLALERRLGAPIGELLRRRVLEPLHMTSTSLPLRGPQGRGRLAPHLLARAVQGYDENGAPIGAPGNVQGYYHWPGTTQIFSSARDLAAFLAAGLGEAGAPEVERALAATYRGVIAMAPSVMQGFAWEIHDGEPVIIDKNGGLNNTSGYVGLAPSRKLGVAILVNRGNQNAAAAGRAILQELSVDP